MLTTSTTKHMDIRDDGTLHDLDPRRRAARLRAAGVTVEREAMFRHVVHAAPDQAPRFRTLAGAERHAHRVADARHAAAA